MNILEEGDGALAAVDYGAILQATLRELRAEDKLFEFRRTKEHWRLRANLDRVARRVCERDFATVLQGAHRAKIASVNFSTNGQETPFYGQVREIHGELKRSLIEAAGDRLIEEQDVLPSLTLPLDELRTSGRAQPGFGYSFSDRRGVSRKRLSLQSKGEPGSRSLLKLHRLVVEVDTGGFDERFAESLRRGFVREFGRLEEDDGDLYEELEEVLEENLNPQGAQERGPAKLRSLLDESALGIVKREATLFYLEHLLAQTPQEERDRRHLERLVGRLKLLRAFLDAPERPDSEYEAAYGAAKINLREALSDAEALDPLPVVAQVAGALGEQRDGASGRSVYSYGLKLKLNGRAMGERTSLDYHAKVIDPGGEPHQHKHRMGNAPGGVRQILKEALLYAFVLDPDATADAAPLAERLLEALRGTDEAAKQVALGEVAETVRSRRVRDQVEGLAKLFRRQLERAAVAGEGTRDVHVGVTGEILRTDPEEVLEERSLFVEDFERDPKNSLKHVSVKPAGDEDWLFSMPVRIRVEDLRFRPAAEDAESFSMSYDTGGMRALPVFLGLLESGHTSEEERVLKLYKDHVHKGDHPFVLLPYAKELESIFEDEDSPKAFAYSLVFALLVYLTLLTLVSSKRERVYVPILRFQRSGEQAPLPEESYLRALSKTLSHLLSESWNCRSQGLNVADLRYKLPNTLSSLYAGVPMRFEREGPQHPRPHLEKLAVVALSSRECDASYEGGRRIGCLYGEAVALETLEDHSVRVSPFGSFAANHRDDRLYHEPEELLEILNRLYDDGFRHVVYLARSPYQSRLSLTAEEDLYFLSKRTLSFLKGPRKDMKIYPVFLDKYFVRATGSVKESSLYVRDVVDLRRIAETGGRKSAPFLHVFNGISVGPERFYNGVLAYSAVLGAHEEDVISDQDIYEGLLFDTWEGKPNHTKEDIVRYLTLFHFSRFEQVSSRRVGFKLEPFDNVFSQQSVARLSVLPHAGGRPDFNMLAFLAEARNAILGGERPPARKPALP